MPRGAFEQERLAHTGAFAQRQALKGAVARLAVAGGIGVGGLVGCYQLYRHLPDIDFSSSPTEVPSDSPFGETDQAPGPGSALTEYRKQLDALNELGFNVPREQVEQVPFAQLSATEARLQLLAILNLKEAHPEKQNNPHPAFPDITEPLPAPRSKAELLGVLNRNNVYQALHTSKSPLFHNPDMSPVSSVDDWILSGAAWDYAVPSVIEETQNGYIIGFNAKKMNIGIDGYDVGVDPVSHPFFLVRLEIDPTTGTLDITVIQDRYEPGAELSWQHDLLARNQDDLDCSRVACVANDIPVPTAKPQMYTQGFDPNSPDARHDQYWHPDSPLIDSVLNTPKAEYTADKAASDIQYLLMLRTFPEFADREEFLPPPANADEINMVLSHNNRALAMHLAGGEGGELWPLFHHPARKDRRGKGWPQNVDEYVSPYEFASLSNGEVQTGKILGYSYRQIGGGEDHSDVRNPTFMFRVELKNGKLEVTAISKRFYPGESVDWEFYDFLRLPQQALYCEHIVCDTYDNVADRLEPAERERLERDLGKRRASRQSLKIDPQDEIDRFKRKAAQKAQRELDRRGSKNKRIRT